MGSHGNSGKNYSGRQTITTQNDAIETTSHTFDMNKSGRKYEYDSKKSENTSLRHQVSASLLGMPLSALSPQPEPEETLQGRHEQRFSVKWLIGISTTGIFVSSLIFVIVIFSLLYPAEHPEVQIYTGSDSVSEESARKTLTFLKDEDFITLDHDASKAQIHKYHEFLITSVEKYMNITANPCHDFYEYACGKWGVHNPPPLNVVRWGNFDVMTLKLWNLMESILKKLANGSNPLHSANDSDITDRNPHGDITASNYPLQSAIPSVRALVIDYYKSCENEELLSLKNVAPLKDMLNQMDQMYITASHELQPLSVFQKVLQFVHHDLYVYAFFSWKVETDNKFRDAMVIELNVPPTDLIQQGIELEEKKQIIETYSEYVKTLLEMVGTFNNNTLHNEVHVITEFFEIFQTMKGSALVNRTDINSLDELAPILNWQKYFNSAFNKVGIYITKEEHILSQIQDYLAVLSSQILLEISTHNVERLYVYLRWQVIQFYSQFIHKSARDAVLPLIHKITNVNTTIISNFRLHPCIKEVVERLPLATTHLLLETFKENLPKNTTIDDNIRSVTEMAEIIRKEFINYIDSFTWLEANVRHILLEKLSKVDIKVGYPPIIDNTAGLQEHFKDLRFGENFFINQISLLKFNNANHMKLLRQPHLYSEWQVLSPLSVISFYLYRRNALLIPLGGLMHPVYSSNLPVYLAYATLGTLISHELGHSVDFVGRTRDLYGRVNITMWDEYTIEDFVSRVKCRAEQYSEMYFPIQGLQTISEVMADDPSVQTAFRASSHHPQHHTLPITISNFLTKLNLSSEQFFFLYYAQMFCSTSSSEKPLPGIKHYPPEWARVIATLANTPEFKTAFRCHKGTTLNPDAKDCNIW